MSTWSVGPVGDNFGALAVRLYRQTPESAAIEAGESHRRAMAARRPLLWVAAMHTAAAFAAMATLPHLPGNAGAVGQLMTAGAVGVAAAFWAVWAWSAVAPLPAAVVALVMYGSLAAVGWSTFPPQRYGATPEGASQVLVLGIAAACVTATVALLVRSVIAAAHARRAALATAGTPAADGGVGSALGLYGLLLAVVAVVPHAVGVVGMMDAMRLIAVVALAWAVASWRTVLPAVAQAGGSWLVVGVVMGLGSFAAASLYLDGTAAAFGLSNAAAADPWVTAGYGWAGAVAASVIFPAVLEELAFRGVIVPCLGRVMTGGETVLVSGAMFAMLHLNPMTVPFLLPMGMALGVLRRRSGSVWPCVLMHLTHNAAVLAAERWM